jgi:hypothetical protein
MTFWGQLWQLWHAAVSMGERYHREPPRGSSATAAAEACQSVWVWVFQVGDHDVRAAAEKHQLLSQALPALPAPQHCLEQHHENFPPEQKSWTVNEANTLSRCNPGTGG